MEKKLIFKFLIIIFLFAIKKISSAQALEKKIIFKCPKDGCIKTLDFFPDGKRFIFSVTVAGKKSAQLFLKNLHRDKEEAINILNEIHSSIIEIFEIAVLKNEKKILINSILEGYKEGGKFVFDLEGKKLIPLKIFPKSYNLKWFLTEDRISFIGRQGFIYQKKIGAEKESLLYSRPTKYFVISRDFKKILIQEKNEDFPKIFSLPNFKYLTTLEEEVISPKLTKDGSKIIYIEKTVDISSQKIVSFDFSSKKKEKITQGAIGKFWVSYNNEILLTLINLTTMKEEGLFILK